MPRKHRAARDRAQAPRPRPAPSAAPGWAQAPGYEVRQVTNQRRYRCPGCDLEIPPGTPHLVAVPLDDPGLRRHWHAHCWRVFLRRGW
jgi:hypothetical protein